MTEYLIRADDGDVLLIPVNDLAKALHPRGINCEPIEGWGDYRMRCGDAEVAVSFEDPGIQVVIEADGVRESTDALADAIAAQITSAIGRATFVVPL